LRIREGKENMAVMCVGKKIEFCTTVMMKFVTLVVVIAVCDVLEVLSSSSR
jgi:hypothetical protein